MDAGQHDRRITIETRSVTRGDYGDEVDSWAELQTVWAQVIQNTGSEDTESRRVHEDVNYTFRIRFRSDVTEEERIKYKGETYDIKSVKELGRRERLEIVGQRIWQDSTG